MEAAREVRCSARRKSQDAPFRDLESYITAMAMAKDYIYAGDSEGRLQVSSDGGAPGARHFKLAGAGQRGSDLGGSNDPRVAVAALGARRSARSDQARPVYVLRTMNGGIFWDDITANLPDAAARTALRRTGPAERFISRPTQGSFSPDGSGISRPPDRMDFAQRKSSRGCGHGRATGCGRESDLCRAGRIRSVRGDLRRIDCGTRGW